MTDTPPIAPSESLGRRIRRLRDAAGWTQEEAGRRAGFAGTRASIIAQWSDLERGRRADPRLSTLRAVSAALSVPPSELIDGIAAAG